MQYSSEVENMCPVAKGAYHGPAPIPRRASGFRPRRSDIPASRTVWVGALPSRARASSRSTSGRASSRRLWSRPSAARHDSLRRHGFRDSPRKTILEALNTDLVCDAHRQRGMREIFLQTCTAAARPRSPRAALAPPDLPWQGPSLPGWHHVRHKAILARYLELAQAVTRMALNDKNEIIAFEFMNLGKFLRPSRPARPRGGHRRRHGSLRPVGERRQVHRSSHRRGDSHVANVFPVHE